MARDQVTWKKAPERTVEAVKLEATARCEGAGPGQTRRRDREPGSESRRPGRNGFGHESASTHHVKKCNGTRRKHNILMRSKVCSVCGISMNRESIPGHEAMCRARRDALNPPKLVKRRTTGKRAPGHVEVAHWAAPMAARTTEKTKKKRHDGKKRHGAQRKEESCS